VERFEQIRRDRDREGLSIRALAERHGVHRRAVRQALVSPLPPAKRAPVSRPAPKLGPYRALIDSWLEADREAPRKQRHTAKRIWRRLVDEHGADVAEVTVRQYVRARKRELGWPVCEVFVPQVHAPGVEAEVDWGRALVELAGVGTTVHLFVMRASFSGAAFCQASLVETQQAFLELHVQAFEWFGGVFAEIRFDNLTSAVKKILKGRRRVESDRFVALGSHYLFCSQFTTPGIEGAHEKGGLAGLRVSARVGAREITISHAGAVVACHERLHGRFGTSARLDHYLDLLARRPGAMEHSLALAQERDGGAWPACFDELWAALTGRYGRSDAARQMVDVVLLCRTMAPTRSRSPFAAR